MKLLHTIDLLDNLHTLKINKYKSPESSPFASPLKTRTLVGSVCTSASVRSTSSFDLPPSDPEKLRLESQVKALIDKLHQRDEECLGLRAAKESLEAQFEALSASHQEQSTALQRLRQDLAVKEEELQVTRERCTALTVRNPGLTAIQNTQEYQELMQELEQLHEQARGDAPVEMDARVAAEVHAIRQQANELRAMISSLRRGSELPMQLVLGTSPTRHQSAQVSDSLDQIRDDLHSIRLMVADYHAEQCGGEPCLQQ